MSKSNVKAIFGEKVIYTLNFGFVTREKHIFRLICIKVRAVVLAVGNRKLAYKATRE